MKKSHRYFWYKRFFSSVLSVLMMVFLTQVHSIVCAVVDYTKFDLSTTPSFNLATGQRVYLVSFAHGEVHERNQNYLALSAINKGIDVMISYRKRHIDQEFYEKNRAVLDLEKGSGYWLWKPYFILETLKMMSENDILIYVDSGIYLKNSVEPIVDKLNEPHTTMLLFENRHLNRREIKRDTYDIMGVDYIHQDDMQLDAAFLALKKTNASCEFIQKWLDYSSIEQAITDAPSQALEFVDFLHHKHDQAILTLLHAKYQDPTIKVLADKENWRGTPLNIFVHHRRREADNPIRNFPGT